MMQFVAAFGFLAFGIRHAARGWWTGAWRLPGRLQHSRGDDGHLSVPHVHSGVGGDLLARANHTSPIHRDAATNLISAENALVWSVSFLVLQPILYGGPSPLHYTSTPLAWALLNGVFNGVGAWT